MSYPVTIPAPYTGYGFGNAPWGSQFAFEYLSAQYAFISQDGQGLLGSGDLKPHCMKSTDLGLTWNEIDAAHAPAVSHTWGGTQYTVWRDGATVYLLSVNRPSSGVVSGFDVWTFNLSTQLWSLSATTYVLPVVAEDTGVSTLVQVAVRGTNDFIFFYSGPHETVSGFPRSRAYYATFDGTTFGTGTILPGQAGSTNNYSPMYACVDASGITHLIYAGGSSGFGTDLTHVGLSALNVFGALGLITGDYATTGFSAPQSSSQLIVIPGSPDRIGFAIDTYESGAFDVAMRLFYADVALNPTWTSSVIIPSDATALEIFAQDEYLFCQGCTLTVQGGTLTCFWMTPDGGLNHPLNVYEVHTDIATLTWSTPTLFLPPPTFAGRPVVYAMQVYSWASVSGVALISTWTDYNLGAPADDVLAEFSFIPSSVPLAITCGSPPSGIIAVAYSHDFSLTTSGGTAPYVWDITSGSLPVGLSLNSSTGVVSGTPAAADGYTFTIRVTDADDATDSVDCSITIAPASDRFTLVLDLKTGAWVQDSYANSIRARRALVQPEGTLTSGSPKTYDLMILADDKGNVYVPSLTAGDNGAGISGLIGTFEWDGQPDRNSGLWESWYIDAVPISGLTVESTMFGQVQSPKIPATAIGATSSRVLVECPVPDGSLNRFLGLQISWTDPPGPEFTLLHSWRNFADPDSVFSWNTRALTFGLHGYLTCGRQEMAYSSTAPVTLNLTAFDGTSSATMTIPSTGGVIQKILVTPTVNKGQLLSFSAASAEPFQIFGGQSLLWIHQWGDTVPWRLYPLGAEEGVKP